MLINLRMIVGAMFALTVCCAQVVAAQDEPEVPTVTLNVLTYEVPGFVFQAPDGSGLTGREYNPVAAALAAIDGKRVSDRSGTYLIEIAPITIFDPNIEAHAQAHNAQLSGSNFNVTFGDKWVTTSRLGSGLRPSIPTALSEGAVAAQVTEGMRQGSSLEKTRLSMWNIPILGFLLVLFACLWGLLASLKSRPTPDGKAQVSASSWVRAAVVTVLFVVATGFVTFIDFSADQIQSVNELVRVRSAAELETRVVATKGVRSSIEFLESQGAFIASAEDGTPGFANSGEALVAMISNKEIELVYHERPQLEAARAALPPELASQIVILDGVSGLPIETAHTFFTDDVPWAVIDAFNMALEQIQRNSR